MATSGRTGAGRAVPGDRVPDAYLITRSAADADEAAQDAFVKAYYALHRFRTQEPFRPWLLRIVSNEAKNRVRSARRRERLALRWPRAVRRGTPAVPEAAAAGARRRGAALGAVGPAGGRSDGHRVPLPLGPLGGRDAEVLGVRQGRSSPAVRALGRLRERLPAG